MAENVKVILRCRPESEQEKKNKCKCAVRLENCTVETWDPNEKPSYPKQFTFDSVYDQNSTTESIYNDICYPLIESVLEGYNSTIFVYGQTGCGKSFTMEGSKTTSPPEKGIISRAFEHIFEAIAVTTGVKYLALVSYLEIYNEQIRDLLFDCDKSGNSNVASLSLKEVPNEGVTVPGLSLKHVHNVAECENLLALGSKNRMIGATLMNQASSRSHSIFTISIEQLTNVNNNECIKKGKLNLVDLAGSERQAKTGATGDRLKEATKINLSLSALGNVISALVDGKAKHIPYRDSKLTRLLQDSLGGNTKTLMIACISPSSRDYAETLSTLRYANRAKNIHNKPCINEDPKDTMLRKYQEEIERLRSLLECNNNNSKDRPDRDHQENSNLNAKRDQLIQEYQNEMEKLKHLHENEKAEKEIVLRQIDTIKNEYQKNVEQLNKQIRNKHQQQYQSKSKEDILQRIEELKAAMMIGGEKADDKELSERRKKKKIAAERRASAIAHVLAKIEMDEDREVLRNQYQDISYELEQKTDALRRCRHKVKVFEKEIADLQAEFESERQDYLETIRKQERSVKLVTQIAGKIASTLKKECNYSDLETMKEHATWNDEAQKYILPELVIRRTKLPPAHGRLTDSIQTAPGRLESDSESLDDGDVDQGNLAKKLEKSEEEDIIANYFKPKRAAQLLSQSTERAFNTWRDFTIDKKTAGRPKDATIKPITSPRGVESFIPNGNTAELRRPFRLEALPNLDKIRKERLEFL